MEIFYMAAVSDKSLVPKPLAVVAEDVDIMVPMQYSMILSEKGWNVVWVKSADQARNAAFGRDFDGYMLDDGDFVGASVTAKKVALMALDNMMPETENGAVEENKGFDLARAIREDEAKQQQDKASFSPKYLISISSEPVPADSQASKDFDIDLSKGKKRTFEELKAALIGIANQLI
jgi:CheY-like chemotaxis protein